MSKKEISIHFHSLSLSYKSTEFKANMIKLLISSCLHYRDFFFAHRNHTAKVYIQQSRHQSLFETMVIKVKFNSNQPKLVHSSNEKLVCTAIFIRGGRQEAAIHLGQQNTQPSRLTLKISRTTLEVLIYSLCHIQDTTHIYSLNNKKIENSAVKC